MTRNLLQLSLLIFLSWATSAHSLPITDTVTVHSREWAQVDLFLDPDFRLDFDDVLDICPAGICGSGLVNGYDVSGWTWATIDDVNVLLNHYIGADQLGPGADRYLELDSAWAPAFFADGWRETDPLYENGIALNGVTRTPSSFRGGLLIGGIYDNSPGRRDNADTSFPHGVFSPQPQVGAWFYRETASPVPLPGTAALVVIALALLVRRNRNLNGHTL